MENQQRELSQDETDAINKIKAHAQATEELHDEVFCLLGKLANLGSNDEQRRRVTAEPLKWLSIAKTDFQTGFMALTRAVAQPTTF